jgi:hypothetical protein
MLLISFSLISALPVLTFLLPRFTTVLRFIAGQQEEQCAGFCSGSRNRNPHRRRRDQA